MKLLLDGNLSRKLVPLIEDLFPESQHVSTAGLHARATDQAIWKYAQENGFAIITADKDFLAFARSADAPKIIVLANCDYPTSEAARLIRKNAVRIAELEQGKMGVLVIPRQ